MPVVKIEARADDVVCACRRWRGIGIAAGADLSKVGQVPWVARIGGPDKSCGVKRQFIRGKKDYSEANSVGSRGVFVFFFLDQDGIYEVNEPRSLTKSDRYFVRVDGDKVVRI